MNWKQYFLLKEKQKQIFWKAFIVLLLLSLFIFARKADGRDSRLCGIINLTSINRSMQLYSPNFSAEYPDSNSTDSIDNTNILDIINSSNNTINTNITNNTENDTSTSISAVLAELPGKMWFSCAEDFSSLPPELKVRLWALRLVYTPLFIMLDLFLAIVFSLLYSLYLKHLIEAGKIFQPEESKDEKSEEKK